MRIFFIILVVLLLVSCAQQKVQQNIPVTPPPTITPEQQNPIVELLQADKDLKTASDNFEAIEEVLILLEDQ